MDAPLKLHGRPSSATTRRRHIIFPKDAPPMPSERKWYTNIPTRPIASPHGLIALRPRMRSCHAAVMTPALCRLIKRITPATPATNPVAVRYAASTNRQSTLIQNPAPDEIACWGSGFVWIIGDYTFRTYGFSQHLIFLWCPCSFPGHILPTRFQGQGSGVTSLGN